MDQEHWPLADGFFYLEYETTVEAWERDWTATEVFFTTEDEAGAIALAERAAEIAPSSPVHTAADRLAQNKETAATINRFMLVVGLLAMLIGGVGIANTMQVVVARRRLETAVLKAVGFKGRPFKAPHRFLGNQGMKALVVSMYS